jgi:hypothetical protein
MSRSEFVEEIKGLSLKRQVNLILKDAGRDTQNGLFNSEGFGGYWDGSEDAEAILDTLGIKHEYEDSFGGEGHGEEYWSVYSFTKGSETVYVKFDGSYASYNGSEYDDYYFVEPKQVMVTRYEKID